MDKISVIIPFYNYSNWLEEAIISVINQSYKNIEIIVVDDGSKEDISDLEKKYCSRVLFFHKKNEGAASARNLGIQVSTGEYVAFLDSDDIWERNKLSIQMKKIKDSGKKWCVCSYKTFGDKNKTSKIVKPATITKKLDELLLDSCKIQTSTILVKKSMLVDNDILFPVDMRKGQDGYVWFRLAQLDYYDYIDKPLVSFRIRENNSYKSVANNIRSRSQIWKKMNDSQDKLLKPKRLLTIIAYKYCSFIVDKLPKVVDSNGFLLKTIYVFPWLTFKLDTCFIKWGL